MGLHTFGVRDPGISDRGPAAGRHSAGGRGTGLADEPAGRSAQHGIARHRGSVRGRHRRRPIGPERLRRLRRLGLGTDQWSGCDPQRARRRDLSYAGRLAPVDVLGSARRGADDRSVTEQRSQQRRPRQRLGSGDAARVRTVERAGEGACFRAAQQRAGRGGDRTGHAQRDRRPVERRPVIGRLPDLGG